MQKPIIYIQCCIGLLAAVVSIFMYFIEVDKLKHQPFPFRCECKIDKPGIEGTYGSDCYYIFFDRCESDTMGGDTNKQFSQFNSERSKRKYHNIKAHMHHPKMIDTNLRYFLIIQWVVIFAGGLIILLFGLRKLENVDLDQKIKQYQILKIEKEMSKLGGNPTGIQK